MMKHLLLLAYLFVAFAGASQTPAGFPDTPVITETSVGRAKIGMPVATLKKLYAGCTFTPIYLSQFGFDDYGPEPGGVVVNYGHQRLFIYLPNGSKAMGFLVFHPAYQTTKGIHVGSTSGQLKGALPAVRVGPSELMAEMDIATVETGEEKMGTQYIFYKQGRIGKNKDFITPSTISVTTARISWIQIYPN